MPSRYRSLILCLLAVGFVTFSSGDAPAARGEYKLKKHSVWSASLGAEIGYRVALPPGYGAPENQNKRYPVIYLLHGLKGSSWDWLYIGRLPEDMDAKSVTMRPLGVEPVTMIAGVHHPLAGRESISIGLR